MDRALMNSAAGLSGLLDHHGRLNVNARRPFINERGESVIVANAAGDTVKSNAPALLQYDEWKDIDRTVIDVAVKRLVGIKDLMSKGLTHSLGSIGNTISLWDRASDMTPANVSMDGIREGEEDTQAFQTAQVPVPIVHKDFRLNLRRLAASRTFGEGLDVTQAAVAGRLVAEKSEDMLFAGSSIVVDGSAIYGYTTFPDRNTATLTLSWTAASKTGVQMVNDVKAMLALLRADSFYGPYVLYVPGTYEGVLDNDYNPSTSDTRTVRQRIMQLSGIEGIQVVDRLADANLILVQMDRNTVDLAIAQDISTVQWQEKGGMQEFFKVMAVWVPRMKSDYDGKCGIAHMS